MNMFRTRVFITLLLTAVAIAILGAGVGIAATRAPAQDDVVAASKVIRPTVGPLSGEPDGSGSGAPQPKTIHSSLSRSNAEASDTWLEELLAHWAAVLRRLRGR